MKNMEFIWARPDPNTQVEPGMVHILAGIGMEGRQSLVLMVREVVEHISDDKTLPKHLRFSKHTVTRYAKIDDLPMVSDLLP